MESFDKLINDNLGWIHENKYVLPVVGLVLVMYAALARPKLPRFMANLFENPIFRFVMIAYIVYRGQNDMQTALLMSGAFLITIHMLNKQAVENFAPRKETKKPSPGSGSGNGSGAGQAGQGSNSTASFGGKF